MTHTIVEPEMPMPGQTTTYANGEEATVIASTWMADPNPDGVFIVVLLLLNQDPDYYTVAWIEAKAPAYEWEARDASTHEHIVDAVHEYEEHTR